MWTSTAVQPPIAASSNSPGVKSVPSPVPMLICPPRSLLAVYRLFSVRSSRTPRWAESVVMAPPCHNPGRARQRAWVRSSPSFPRREVQAHDEEAVLQRRSEGDGVQTPVGAARDGDEPGRPRVLFGDHAEQSLDLGGVGQQVTPGG